MAYLDYLVGLSKKFDAIHREELRRLGSIAETECQICKRKVTVRQGPWGPTLVVCSHILKAIKKDTQKSEVRQLGVFPYTVYELPVELLNDGPRRWGFLINS